MARLKRSLGRKIASAHIRALRERLGLTQREAADLVYVQVQAWSQWERGVAQMPVAAWELLLLKSGMPIDWTPDQPDQQNDSDDFDDD